MVLQLLVAGGGQRQAAAASEIPEFVDRNPTCEDLGYDVGVRFDPPTPGTMTLGFGTVSFTTTDGIHFDWTSTTPIDAVTSKGGDGANVYRYDPASLGDTNLQSPDNASGGPAEISHIDFCVYRKVGVTKTAAATYDAAWDWSITKTADDGSSMAEPLLLGGFFDVNYSVTAKTGAPTLSNFQVAGDITISNPWDVDARVISVTDTLSSGESAEVTCPSALVPAGKSIICTYAAEPAGLASGTNTATVVANFTGTERTSTGTAIYVFPMVPTVSIDECVEVVDSFNGGPATVLGEVCAADGSRTFTYVRTFGPADLALCDTTTEFPNTATATENDTARISTASHTVYARKNCATGCTLTQGYWKTHSDRGPAPYDDSWGLVGIAQEDTLFFKSGQSWYTTFWTPPAGNAFYNLAHQYMAAKLNVLNGATAPAAVQAALTAAETLFNAQGVNDTTLNRAERTAAINLAATLDAYNNGLTGPGHCAE